MHIHSVANCLSICFFVFFFFNDTATTEIYTLSLHDALPIWTTGILSSLMRIPTPRLNSFISPSIERAPSGNIQRTFPWLRIKAQAAKLSVIVRAGSMGIILSGFLAQKRKGFLK